MRKELVTMLKRRAAEILSERENEKAPILINPVLIRILAFQLRAVLPVCRPFCSLKSLGLLWRPGFPRGLIFHGSKPRQFILQLGWIVVPIYFKRLLGSFNNLPVDIDRSSPDCRPKAHDILSKIPLRNWTRQMSRLTF
jgi:hypothetical protein